MGIYKVNVEGDELAVDQTTLKTLDVSRIDDANFHVLHNHKAFRVELLYADYGNKTIKVEVNGNSYTMQIRDCDDQMVEEMGLLVGTTQRVKDIKAPMPGLIVEVMVKAGQEISEGTPLIILSAMKMENILLAQADGKIKSIKVEKADTVDKGQLIIEME